MKNRILLLVLGALCMGGAGPARATLIAYEGFDITAGENALNGAAGATSSGWTNSSTWGTGANDVGAGLGYGSLQTVGGAAVLDTSSGSFRLLSRPLTQSSTPTLWMSFLSVVPNNSAGTYGGISFYNNFGNEMFFVGDLDSANTNWGMRLMSVPGAPIVTTGINSTNLSFLVLRIDFNAGVTNNENFYLWVNPLLDSEPNVAAADATILGAQMYNGQNLARIRLQQGLNSDNTVIDELRLGTTWNDVAPVVPEPGTAVLWMLGLAVWSGLRRHRARAGFR